MTNSVQAPADWKVPTRQLMTPNAPIIEEPLTGANQTHYDTVGAMARMLNNLYEHCKPPLIHDYWQTALQTTSAISEELAQWKTTSNFVGTGLSGSDREELEVWVYCDTDGSASTLTVEIDGVSVTSPSFNHAAYTWYEVTQNSTLKWEDTAGEDWTDYTFVLSGSTGGTLDVKKIIVNFASSRATLPSSGRMTNEFIPCDPAQYSDESQALNVEMMQRLINDANDLKRRRCAGVICSKYFYTAAQDKSKTGGAAAASDTRFMWLAFQPEHVTSCRVWIYGQDGGVGGRLVTISFGTTISETIEIRDNNLTWHYVDVFFDHHEDEYPRVHDMRMDLDGVDVQAICAWWHPIERAF